MVLSFEEVGRVLDLLNSVYWIRGLPLGAFIYDVCKILGFFDTLVMYINQLILFLLSAFLVPPSPLPVRTSYMDAPLATTRPESP